MHDEDIATVDPDPWWNTAGTQEGRGVPHRRNRNLWLFAVVALGVFLLTGAGIALWTTRNTTTPNTNDAAGLARIALVDAAHAGSFHYVSVFTQEGTTQTIDGDAGPVQGRQDITGGGQRFTVLVAGNAVFFQGNALSVQQQLNLIPSVAAAHNGQWIYLAPTDGPYQSVYEAVTTQSALEDNVDFNPTSAYGTRRGKQSVVDVTGTVTSLTGAPAHGRGSLLVDSESPHLPIRYEAKGTINGHKFTLTITFGRWGEKVTVRAPPGPVPYASIAPSAFGSSPTPTEVA